MYKSYRYRVYPNKQQQKQIEKTLSACDFLYNAIIDYQKQLVLANKFDKNKAEQIIKDEVKNLKNNEWKNKCKALIENSDILKTTNTDIFENVLNNLMRAYINFYLDKANAPRRKSKEYDNEYKSYKISNKDKLLVSINYKNQKISVDALGDVKAKLHRTISGDLKKTIKGHSDEYLEKLSAEDTEKIKSVVVTKEKSGKYYISLNVEFETQDKVLPVNDEEKKAIGIDLGIKELCITSKGKKYENPKTIKKYEDKLNRLNEQLANKKPGSKNYEKTRKELILCWEKIRNTRQDYRHKISRQLVEENDYIYAETLNINKMRKDKTMEKWISDASWGELLRQIKYKANWGGKEFKQVNNNFPSSKRCGVCGELNEELKDLNIRKWVCPNCGAKLDRDINAAKNICLMGKGKI